MRSRRRRRVLPSGGAGSLERAYELLVRKLGIESAEAPIMEKDGRRILFHSTNFCPTLEACKIGGAECPPFDADA